LHEAAGGRDVPAKYSVPILHVLKGASSKLEVDEILSIDRERKIAVGKEREYPYEYLVITLGWVPEYFGIPGLKEHSLVLTNIDTAAQIRKHIEEEFHRYEKDGDERHLRIVVGGAGLTGIELVGELVDWLPQLCLSLGIDFSKVDIQNIEAMPSILPQVAEPLRENAMRVLTEKGAKLRTNTKILRVEAGQVHLDGGEVVEAGTIIWTGGVRANPILQQAGFTVDRRGRAKVNQFLQSVDDDHVFIGGDSAWCELEEGKPLPPTAQVATQMGRCLARNVSSAVHGRPLKPFEVHLKGVLASLGREVGVGDMMGMKVKGVIAGLAKEATKVKYLWELGGLRLTVEKTNDVVHLR
jgi:NADH dehydrogenase